MTGLIYSVTGLLYSVSECDMAPIKFDRVPVQCGRAHAKCDRAPVQCTLYSVQCERIPVQCSLIGHMNLACAVCTRLSCLNYCPSTSWPLC